jgi:hypothetical protein
VWSGGDGGDQREELTNQWPWQIGEEAQGGGGGALRARATEERRWPFIEESASWRRGHDGHRLQGVAAWAVGQWRRVRGRRPKAEGGTCAGKSGRDVWHRPAAACIMHRSSRCYAQTDGRRRALACTYGGGPTW